MCLFCFHPLICSYFFCYNHSTEGWGIKYSILMIERYYFTAFTLASFWAKLKNGQHHHEKLKFDVGITCLAV